MHQCATATVSKVRQYHYQPKVNNTTSALSVLLHTDSTACSVEILAEKSLSLKLDIVEKLYAEGQALKLRLCEDIYSSWHGDCSQQSCHRQQEGQQ